MAYKFYTISEICDWYSKFVDKNITPSLINHFIEKGIIKRLPNKRYSLSEINNLLLVKEDCDYIKNDNDKFIIKPNRYKLLEIYNNNNIQNENTKFKITKLEGNKLKLTKN